MLKKNNDFSLREEVKLTLQEKLNTHLSEDKIDEIIDSILEYDTFLSFVSLFINKGIKEVAENHSIDIDLDSLEEQSNSDIKGISLDDLVL